MDKYIQKYKKIVFLTALLFSLVISSGILYISTHFYIENYGINITPHKDIETFEVNHYLQNDPAWANDTLGNTNYSMGNYGCLVSVLSSSLNHSGIDLSPKDLNKSLSDNKAYTSNGQLIWYKINEIYPGVDYYYQRIFTGRTISNHLAKGELPMVEVKYKKTGVRHWLLVVGAKDGDFLVIDPLEQSKQPIKLNSSHGRVYAYRTLNH